MPKKPTYQPIETSRPTMPKLRAVAFASVALPLTVCALGTATIALSSVTATEAHAFGWSDVKGAAKKVGGAVKKGAKKAGKKAGYVAKHGGKIAGGLAKDAAKGAYKGAKAAKKVNDAINYVPRTIQKTTRDAALKAAGKIYSKYQRGVTDAYANARGINTPAYQQQTKDAERATYNRISGAGRLLDKTLGAAKRKVGAAARRVGRAAVGKQKIGGTLPGSVQQAARRQSASNKMFRHKAGGTRQDNLKQQRGKRFRTGVVTNGKFLGRKPARSAGKDRSIFGRTVGGKRRLRSVSRITKSNVRQRRTIRRRKLIGRDRSAFGRPASRRGNRKSSKRFVTRKRNTNFRNRIQRDRRNGFNRMRRSGRKAFRINNNRNNRFNRRSFSRRSSGRRG